MYIHVNFSRTITDSFFLFLKIQKNLLGFHEFLKLLFVLLFFIIFIIIIIIVVVVLRLHFP